VTFRRPGEIPLVLHSDKATVDEARRQLVRKNLKTIQAKGVEPFIQGMKPEFSNDQQLDLDASLYSGDFFGDFEACREEIAAFHGALVEEVRWSVAQRMPRDRFQELALRIIYRNGFDCPQAKRAGDDFVRARLEGKSPTVDFRGKERPSHLTLRAEIQAELKNGVDEEGLAFLKTVAEAFHLNLHEIEAEAGSAGSTAEPARELVGSDNREDKSSVPLMDSDTIESLVVEIREKNGEWEKSARPGPCPDGDIQAAERAFREEFGRDFPNGYKRLVALSNGVYFDGMTIWPATPEAGFEETILEANRDLRDTFSGDFLYFGQNGEELFALDLRTDRFVAIEFVGKPVWAEFADSVEMIRFMLHRNLRG
jgi:hypothetical protein